MADSADLATDGGPPSPVEEILSNQANPQTPGSRWRKLMAGYIGPLLDALVFIFLVTVFVTGQAGWWVTLPGPNWLHYPAVFAWGLFAFFYWITVRLVSFRFLPDRPWDFRTPLLLWKSSHRFVACLLMTVFVAEILTWLLLAMLAADTIRYYQLWTTTGGDVSCWVPMCLLVGILIGLWMWSVLYRRSPMCQRAIHHRRYRLGWPTTAVIIVATAASGILTSAFPNPPKHRVGLAVVLGNHVLANDTPGCVLRGRLRAAIWLYKHGLVKYIMVSGRAKYGRDNPKKNEPLAMAVYCLEHHIPDRALVVDYFGNNTRYTVYHAIAWMRAHHVKHVVGVSSIYHLPRIYIAFRQLGVTPYTVASIKRGWREINPWGLFRECVAVPVYGLDTHYHQPAGGLNGHWLNRK